MADESIHTAMLADFAKRNLAPEPREQLARHYLTKARMAWLVGDVEGAFDHYIAHLYLKDGAIND